LSWGIAVLRDQEDVIGGVIMHGQVFDAQCERRERQIGGGHLQDGFDFLCHLIGEVHEPPTHEWQRLGRVTRQRFTAQPDVEIVDEAAGSDFDAAAAETALRVTHQRGGRLRHQQAVARERAFRGAVEEHRPALGLRGRERPQGRAGHGDVRQEGRAVGHAARCDQPLKRRKISEPLVPPNPNEFESAASTVSWRAVFGT
jgi:hypothetical protein